MVTIKKATRAKKTTRGTPAKTVKTNDVAEKTAKKPVEAKGLTAAVVGIDGKAKGRITLPKEVFGEKLNKQLIAQAVRVYMANQRAGGAATKTRGMVEGSTRKIYRQKGTGRARHGNIRAPIFVGGGIVFGPVPHKFSLTMPRRMKRKALSCALSSQYNEGNLIVVDGLEKVKPKTKHMEKTLCAVSTVRPILLVTAKNSDTVIRIARNIADVDYVSAAILTTYDVLSHKKILFMKDAIGEVKEIIMKEA
jgi:large subunit ribosomal protein L4